MKNAFRYIGIGLFLAGSILFALTHFNVLDGATKVSQVSTTLASSTSTTSAMRTTQMTTTTTQTTTVQTTQAPQETSTSQRSGEVTSFVVTDAATTYSVADDLIAAGIINDADAFIKHMEDNNLSRFIQTGTFSLRKGMSLQELGEALTTYPGN
ncbi:hypothetical protein KG089_01930 [Carnobacteriaceae bacterium zg-ZUI252]|nr:hypothetical protein [Carnobacteriaceae bacterium zg-ZUI252]MBS4770576.1 hypothetical protein [Carnobacteriaceae bacterium zg-ZUI240]